MIANVNRDPKRRPEPYSPSDFMPKFGRVAEKRLMNQDDWNEFKKGMIEYAKSG
jgi:hypothetical protein